MRVRSLRLVLPILVGGCATVDCDLEATEGSAPDNEAEMSAAREECEHRMDEARRRFKDDQDAREAAARQNAFRNRNEGKHRGR